MDFARLARNSIHGRDTIAVKRLVQDLSEVLLPDTEGYDRSDKFADDRNTTTFLQDYEQITSSPN